MADVIQLLPDAIANQIAAGEVIQRPASVVKELLENAIDAGSTRIKLIIKDAGKTLIQVIDNGCGMSETDARMCFERHATSKIRKAQDLFAIRTMGFRGEALASVAAVAQVEMKTRKPQDELACRIVIEGSILKTQEVCQANTGTSIAVKNLFFNIPARRNFLKTNAVEMRHIMDEFQRIAIAHPDVFFSMHHNRVELYHLPPAKLRQRVVGVFGHHANQKLVPVKEETDIIKINGFIGKPKFAKKTRGEQLFFVNNRFIKSGYLNHAVMQAYEELLPKDTYPLYVLFLDIDPSAIDINVHPTKQEIKFEDERLVYNYLKVAVRHALGQYSITPTIDFDQELNFSNFSLQQVLAEKTAPEKGTSDNSTTNKNTQNKNKGYNGQQGNAILFSSDKKRQANNLANWQKLYEGLEDFEVEREPTNNQPLTIKTEWNEHAPMDDMEESFAKQRKQPYQIHNSYIVSQIKSGFLLIDQQNAHERILYEKYLLAIQHQPIATQKELFPKTIQFSIADAEVMKMVLPQINTLGFDIQEFGNNMFVIHGIPADLKQDNVEQIIEKVVEQYKNNLELKLGIQENVARALAKTTSIKRKEALTPTEMQHLINELFACQTPHKGLDGKVCFITYSLTDLEKKFS